jgi:hypothetical protein
LAVLEHPQARVTIRRQLPVGAIVLLVVAASVAVAALSLVVTSAIAFDPEAWIVWARELFGPGYLTTGGGPAWKPMPVLVIGPFTWITRGEADVYFWLLIARTGALLAVAGVAALAWRIAGRYAAVIAAVVVVASPWWFYNGILGNAEPLMVALIAGAVLAHDAGARRTAAVLTLAAALVRPEVWPFALIYGMWLAGKQWRRWVVLGACIAFVLGAWAVPELLHTGATAVGAATGKATSSSARYSSIPFLAVFKDAFDQLTVVPGVLAALALVAIGAQIASSGRVGGLRRVRASLTLEWAIGLFAVGWIAIVGVMAEIGFAGNPRYLVPAVAAAAICAGVFAVRLCGTSELRRSLAVVVVAAASVAAVVGTVRHQVHEVSGHAKVAAEMRRELAVRHCAGLYWTFDANRSTLAQLTGQSVGQSAHALGFRVNPGQFVYCAPPSALPATPVGGSSSSHRQKN